MQSIRNAADADADADPTSASLLESKETIEKTDSIHITRVLVCFLIWLWGQQVVKTMKGTTRTPKTTMTGTQASTIAGPKWHQPDIGFLYWHCKKQCRKQIAYKQDMDFNFFLFDYRGNKKERRWRVQVRTFERQINRLQLLNSTINRLHIQEEYCYYMRPVDR